MSVTELGLQARFRCLQIQPPGQNWSLGGRRETAHPQADWMECGECCVWMRWPVGARFPGSPAGGPTRGDTFHTLLCLWEWWSSQVGQGWRTFASRALWGPEFTSALSLRITATAFIFSFLRRHTWTSGLVLHDSERFLLIIVNFVGSDHDIMDK